MKVFIAAMLVAIPSLAVSAVSVSVRAPMVRVSPPVSAAAKPAPQVNNTSVNRRTPNPIIVPISVSPAQRKSCDKTEKDCK